MYYLHKLDGTPAHRPTLIYISESPDAPRVAHAIGNSPLVDEHGNPQNYEAGWLLGPVPTDNEARTLAMTLAERYGYQVAYDGAIMAPDDARLGAKWITSREAQAIVESEWGNGDTVPISSITHACRQGHIRAAKKQGRDWVFREKEFWHWLNNRPKPGRKTH